MNWDHDVDKFYGIDRELTRPHPDDEPEHPCPKCGAETIRHHGFFTGLEYVYRSCEECGWEGEPI